uniref:Hexosyltransferase n=3 Tax=Triticinae TaxID=1648030 RepID=A0A453PXQ1_AEGTS
MEEATGLAFRFVIGKSNDKSKMAALEREVEEYDDFVLLDLEEEYSRLPYKTLAFFKAAYALFDSDFYVKADDDIYLRPGEQETDNIQDICSRWLLPTYTNFIFVRYTYTNINWMHEEGACFY